MTEDRLILAIGRLERSLTRLERAAARPADQGLAERHRKLRDRVEGAIATLDELIARG